MTRNGRAGEGGQSFTLQQCFSQYEYFSKEKFESVAKGQVSFGFAREDLARLKSWTKDVNSHWHESVRNPADGELFLGKHGLELVLAILCPVITVPPEAARFSDLHVPKVEEPPTAPLSRRELWNH